jgi:hypothetical protein
VGLLDQRPRGAVVRQLHSVSQRLAALGPLSVAARLDAPFDKEACLFGSGLQAP